MASRSFVLLVADQRGAGSSAPARLGITVSRRVGGSVVRVRVKRRLREWFRRNRSVCPQGKDVVVIARPAAATLRSEELARELDGVFARLARADASS
jgi:ribonuclease P protein component